MEPFIKNIVQWFIEDNKCNFNQKMREILFGVRNTGDDLFKKLNYNLVLAELYL